MNIPGFPMFGFGMNPLLANQGGINAQPNNSFSPSINGINQFQLMAAAQMLQSQMQNRKPQNSFQ